MGVVANVKQGPVYVYANNVQLGHTQGGVKLALAQTQRAVNVDQYGQNPVNHVYQGDNVTLTVPFAEYTAQTLRETNVFGNDQTAAGSGDKYMGYGRSAGVVATAKNIKLIPILAADGEQRIEIWRAVPRGQFDLNFNADNDKIFNCEYVGLVDETKTEGELIMRVYNDVSSVSVTTTTTTTTAAP